MSHADDRFDALISGRIRDFGTMRNLCLTFQENQHPEEKIRSALSRKTHCHPRHPGIREIIRRIPPECASDSQKAKWLFEWRLNHLSYGRLKKPLFPLIRTDLDMLELKEGTCGDFSHLFVSFMQALKIPARYGIVERDLYGDAQDHICAAFRDRDESRWISVDPTPSYGKVAGWDIGHRTSEWRDPEEHWAAIREEEIVRLHQAARRYRSLLLSGIIFAPWMYEEIIEVSQAGVTSVFVLLATDDELRWKLHVTCHMKGQKDRSCPIRLRTDSRDVLEWDECANEQMELWDEARWEPRGQVTRETLRRNPWVKRATEVLKWREKDFRQLIDWTESEKARLNRTSGAP